MRRWLGACVGCVLLVQPAPAQLPIADTEPRDLIVQCRNLLAALERLRAPWPAEFLREVQPLLRDEARVRDLQKLVDSRCLIGVTINPESRVKAARGPAVAELVLDRPVYVLVKVMNEAGVTQALSVSGPQLRTGAAGADDAWLEAVVVTEPPLPKTLTGQTVDYVLVKLIAREAGKREATLRFDAGQGTQDLGFRAEVPVLFTVRN